MDLSLTRVDARQLSRRSFLQLGTWAGLATVSARFAAASPAGSPAFPDAAERSLSFYNLHTTESLKTVYWARGEYIPESLKDINRVLRDHRNGEQHEIDQRLLDLLCQLNAKLDTAEPFQIISGYRSPATNAMLHARSNGVATHSLHTDGMAADIRVAGRDLKLVRTAALSLKRGGVGYYPSSQFVHVDVGRVRTW
jgi:uncharacterized protein YcbK (DUF882 family)